MFSRKMDEPMRYIQTFPLMLLILFIKVLILDDLTVLCFSTYLEFKINNKTSDICVSCVHYWVNPLL